MNSEEKKEGKPVVTFFSDKPMKMNGTWLAIEINDSYADILHKIKEREEELKREKEEEKKQ